VCARAGSSPESLPGQWQSTWETALRHMSFPHRLIGLSPIAYYQLGKGAPGRYIPWWWRNGSVMIGNKLVYSGSLNNRSITSESEEYIYYTARFAICDQQISTNIFVDV